MGNGIVMNQATYKKMLRMTAPFKKINLYRIVRRVLERRKWKLIEANQEQLWRGEASTGRKLTMPYANYTIKKKAAKGQPTDRITLKDTGDFYRSIVPKFGDKEHVMIAKDRKAPILEKEWGRDILGIQKKEAMEIGQEIADEVAKEILNDIKKAR